MSSVEKLELSAGSVKRQGTSATAVSYGRNCYRFQLRVRERV